MSNLKPAQHINKDGKNLLSANNSHIEDFCSLISEAKPAKILVNDCGEIEIEVNKNQTYFYAQELIFHTDNINNNKEYMDMSKPDFSINSDKLCCFAEAKNGSLLLATEKGVVGTINLNKSMTVWLSVLKTNMDVNNNLNANDDLYDTGHKKLVDLCVDATNEQIIILTKFTNKEKPEFRIEIYAFNESINEMSLTRIFNLSQSLASSSTSQNEPSEFVRIYLDKTDNSFVMLDSNNHKVYWFNMLNCQIRRSVKSADGESIQNPTGLVLFSEQRLLYICSKKGMLIVRTEHQSVNHDSLKPIDICYSPDDHSLYFIDEYALYRSKITDITANEQRFKRIFSNKIQKNRTFRRVLVCKKYIFVMSNDINSLFVIERDHLKL